MRIGQGFDMHGLVEGRPLILAGVTIPHDRGPLGHSDGDVVLHAIADAILGDIDDATGAPAAHLVEATIPRTNVISVQTPQVFSRKWLRIINKE